MGSGLLVAGASSDAGKSVVAAGVCRWLRGKGVRVAPFKAQNMSNNSTVVIGPDGRGGEIGRAQAAQADACGVPRDVRFNPVLLKPESDQVSQVVALGSAIGRLDASGFSELRSQLRDIVFTTLDELRREYDVVVCEGAGSPAEFNLRDGDMVNMGLARAAGFPAIVVGDVDRGGVFASLFGTLALLEPADQALVTGFVLNKFRGDASLLRPAIDGLARLTGRPTLGVLPWNLDIWLDAEDSVAYGRVLGRPAPPKGRQWLRVAVVRFPRISNATDAEALATEPGVQVRLTAEPAEIDAADLVVLPGSKATVCDLDWLRRTGLAEAVARHAAAGKPLLGVCGGYQMLGERITDRVESRRGVVAGLGLLPVATEFSERKTVSRPEGTAFGAPVSGYEIRNGEVTRVQPSVEPLITTLDGRGEGAVNARGNVFGTHWHGALESDEFRRAFLTRSAALAGRREFSAAPDTNFLVVRERALDLLGDLVEEHLDTELLWRIIERGAAGDLPFVPPGPPR